MGALHGQENVHIVGVHSTDEKKRAKFISGVTTYHYSRIYSSFVVSESTDNK